MLGSGVVGSRDRRRRPSTRPGVVTMLKLPPGEGVLPNHTLLQAVEAGVIAADVEIPERNVQPASLDLRLGDRAYRIRCSFLPDDETVERKAKAFIEDTLD